MNKFKRSLILIIAALIGAAPAFCVTPDEMEKARVIAAQAYLRYVNNGSGYLDEVHPSSMADLESHLKDKEKENLKKFKSVGNPKDYSSWNKQQLAEYWSKTFLNAPGLDPAGKAAGRRISSRINDMTVSAPQEKQAQEEENNVTSAQEENQQLNEQPESEKTVVEPQPAQPETVTLPTDEVATDKEERMEDEIKEEEKNESGESSSPTVLYVLLLVVLIIAVIWMVVYAVNISKKQNMEKSPIRRSRPLRRYEEEEDYEEETERPRRRNYPSEPGNSREIEEMRRSFAATLADKDRRISALQERYDELQTTNAENLAHISRLRREVAELKIMRDEARVDRAAEAAPAHEERRRPQQPRQTHTIYLGKVQANGVFVRADRDVVPGQTIFKLVTTDGVSGSFTVVENQKSQDVALDMPENFLINGCNGDDLFDTDGKMEIITDTAGTAIFESGVWKVTRKANISYR